MRKLTSGAAHPAAADIRGDSGEPARARLLIIRFAQLLPMAPRLQQCLLRQVFGSVSVARGAQTDAQYERTFRVCGSGRQHVFGHGQRLLPARQVDDAGA